ncbi:MAG TPA: nickel insertion protein, partial [Pirellulales bacterium]
ERQPHRVETHWGPVEGKLTSGIGAAPAFSPEFDSCSRIAAQHNVPLKEVYAAAQRAFGSTEK